MLKQDFGKQHLCLALRGAIAEADGNEALSRSMHAGTKRRLISIEDIADASTGVHESARGLVHWLRAKVYGECPECHGTHLSEVYGWDKLSCNHCRFTWKAGL